MSRNLLIIGFVWPEPDSTAAGSRMLQLISFFQKNGYQITFVCTASKTEKSYFLEELHIQTHDIELNNTGFDNLIKQIDPNIVLFDRFLTEEQFGWRVTQNCPEALQILDTEDLHFLRHARYQAFKDKKELSFEYLVNDLAKRELASIYRCDLTLIISKHEMKLLSNTFKVDKSLLIYLPFLIDRIDKKILDSYSSFTSRKNFMTIGNFRHEPNWNAVMYLKNTIWPLIREKLPNAEMHIYGSYATDKVNQLHNKKEGFIIKGWAENTKDAFVNAKVCLTPLQFGAGLKGKLIDAMLYGTPSITTNIGAEAMHDDLHWNGFICDDPVEFAEKSITLYQNEKLWLKAQKNGVAIINQCFDKEKYEIIFMQTIQHIHKQLKDHRLKNFVGAMLQHHTLKSTKYLSKWIEEKNK